MPCAENNNGKANQKRRPIYKKIANWPNGSPKKVKAEIAQLDGMLINMNISNKANARLSTWADVQDQFLINF